MTDDRPAGTKPNAATPGTAPTYVPGAQNQIPTVAQGPANMAPTVITHPAPGALKAAPLPNIPDVRIESEIGRGGMGVVYRGRQTYIDRRVAVKLLSADLAAHDQQYISRFQREAKLLAGLSHPNIVSCYSAGVTPDNSCYLVMEYIDGPNLAAYIDDNGVLSEADTLGIIRDLASALEHARRNGIIHRDVKAENILLQKREGSGAGFPYVAKLADLGLARPTALESDMRLTKPGVILGSPATMAPEQYDDPDHVDHRADIYGLGCVMFHAVTGQLPYTGTSLAALLAQKVSGPAPDPRDITTSTSIDFSELTRDLLLADKELRLDSYDALIARCDKVLGISRRRRQFPKWLIPASGLALVAVVIVAAVIALALNRGGRPPEKSPASAPASSQRVSIPNRRRLLSDAVFRTPVALFDADRIHYLAGWHMSGAWAPGEDTEDVLVGHASAKETSSIRRALHAPWRLQGVLRFDQQQPAGWNGTISITLGEGDPIALTIKDLGDRRLFSLGDRSATYSGNRLRFTVIALQDMIGVGLDGKDFATQDLSSPPTGIGFTVTGGLLRIETLELKKP